MSHLKVSGVSVPSTTEPDTDSVPSRWAKPQDVDGLAVAFGGTMRDLLPPYADIPAEFKNGRSTWVEFQNDWFFQGLKGATFAPKAGIDASAGKRHLAAIQASWEPKHEHKEAAVAWLASLWFESATANGKTYGGEA